MELRVLSRIPEGHRAAAIHLQRDTARPAGDVHHTAQCDRRGKKKQFALGNVTVTDDNDYIAYSNSEYSVTLDAIRDKLIKTHGGYLTVRYSGDVKYLDYLEDFSSASIQTVEYGKNLLDVKITRDHMARISALLRRVRSSKETDAEGHEVETDKRVDISSVNGGVNYVYDADAVAEIGWVWRTEVWEDVTIPYNLLRKSQARLAELINGVISMELTIVDESDTGAEHRRYTREAVYRLLLATTRY